MSQTLTIAHAVVGGVTGSLAPHPDVVGAARGALQSAAEAHDVVDARIFAHGSAVAVAISHTLDGIQAAHQLAWAALVAGADVARRLRLDEAGSGLGADAFSGSLSGTGISVAEVTYGERPAEVLLVGLAARASAGAFNVPLVRGYADPFASPGLAFSGGYNFEVHDVLLAQKTMLAAPADLHDLLRCTAESSRYLIKRVVNSEGEVLAASSSERAVDVTGSPGDDAPVVVARAGGRYPTIDALLAPYLDVSPTPSMGGGITPLLPARVPVDGESEGDVSAHPRVHMLALHVADGRFVAVRDVLAAERFDAARGRARSVTEWWTRSGASSSPSPATEAPKASPAAGRWSEM